MSRTSRSLTAVATLAVLAGAGTLVSAGPADAIEPVVGRANVFVEVAHTSASPTPSVVRITSDRAAEASVSRSSRGSYTVTLRNVTGTKGNAQLFMTHRTDRPVDAICSIKSVTPSSTRTRIAVKCFDAITGRTTDAADFAISYASRNVIDSFSDIPGFFTLTSASSTSSHRPTTQFRSDPSGTKARVTRTATGVYQVRIPTADEAYPSFEGTAFATAVGSAAARYCNPLAITPANTAGPDGQASVVVTVGCFDRLGVPANSRFSLVLTLGNQYGIQLKGAAQYVPTPWSDTPAGTFSYGYNPESYNEYVRTTAHGSVAESVTFNDLFTDALVDLDAYAVSGFGGNQRCVVDSRGSGPGLLDATLVVQCRNSEGTEIEAGFAAGHVV